MRDTLFILAADKDNGLFVYDLGTPGFINQRGASYRVPGFCNGLGVRDTVVAIASDDAGVVLVNIADPDNKTLISSIDTPGEARKAAFYGDYLFVADGIAGLSVIDVSDMANPELVYQSDTQVGDAQDIAIASFGGVDYLALAIGSDGVLFYSLENPSEPMLISRLETMYAYGVAADDNLFYIADRDWGVVAVEYAR